MVDQSTGGLGGLGGIVNSRGFGNMLQAAGMSMMGAPRNNPLRDFGKFYTGMQEQQAKVDDRDQQRAAIAAALKSWGVTDAEAAVLSANPSAAEIRIKQLKDEKDKAANDQWMSGIPGLLGGAEAPQPTPESAVTFPGVSDASALPPDLERAQVPQEYGGANVLSQPGAAQVNRMQFTPGGAIADTDYLEATPPPGPGAEIPLAKPVFATFPIAPGVVKGKSPPGLPATAQHGAIKRAEDGKTYQYIQLSGGTDGIGEWGWNEVSTGAPPEVQTAGNGTGNRTVAWLQENDPEAAALIDQGFSPKDALDIAMVRQKSRKPAQEGTTQVAQAQTPQPSNLDQLYRNRDAIAQYLAKAPSKEAFNRGKMYLDIYDKQIERAQKQGGVYEERAAAARQYGLDPNSDEFRNFILSGKLPDPPSARDQFGLNPIYGKDKDGNLIVMQPSKSGGLVTAELPEGVTLQPGTGKIDLGTEWGITDRSGMIIQRIPKDLAGAEAQKAEGKSRGEASFDLPRVEQNAEQTLGILERMKTHPGREGSTGFVQGILPSRTSEQVDFQSLVDQTQGQSFLQAFQMLKGAGQITEIEGQKATVAISRLGNQRLSDADYLKAITDLEEVVKKGLARAKKQAGQSGQGETEAPAPAATGSGLKWSIEE